VNLIDKIFESDADIDEIIEFVEELCDAIPFPVFLACEILAS
jgi:hypothetical protein